MATRRIAPHCAPRCATTARCLLLPGALSRAEDFVSEGFVADLQAAAPACDVVLAEAHLGYFVEGPLIERLREDAVRPGRGGPKPWLVGVSLGGFAALAYAMHHPSEIAGVLAIAPDLGRRTLLRDITAAGGPVAWSQPPPPAAGTLEAYEAIEDDLWRWLARRADEPAAASRESPPLFLGYGLNDRFADAQRQLQSMLPSGNTTSAPGGHDWPPWRALWRGWLQRGLLVGPGCKGTT